MKRLPITSKGAVIAHALVDDDVYEWAKEWGWFLRGVKRYPARRVAGRNVYLHLEVGEQGGGGRHIDHINGDVLDARRENLRFATPSQNGQNRRGAAKHSKTGVRNVVHCPYVRARPYRVVLRIDGKQRSFGQYATLEEAEAVAKAARSQHMPYSGEGVASEAAAGTQGATILPYERRRRRSTEMRGLVSTLQAEYAAGARQADLARRYGLNSGYVSKAVNDRLTWGES